MPRSLLILIPKVKVVQMLFKGVGAEGSVRSKGGDVGAEGAKGTKLKGSRDGDRPALPSKESRVGKLARRVAGDAAGKIAKVAADTAISRFRKKETKSITPTRWSQQTSRTKRKTKRNKCKRYVNIRCCRQSKKRS